jgi:hypothetical protein
MMSASYSKSFGNFSKNVFSIAEKQNVVHLACRCTMAMFSWEVAHLEYGNELLQVFTVLDCSSAMQGLFVRASLNKQINKQLYYSTIHYNSLLRLLQRMNVGEVADVSEVHST